MLIELKSIYLMIFLNLWTESHADHVRAPHHYEGNPEYPGYGEARASSEFPILKYSGPSPWV